MRLVQEPSCHNRTIEKVQVTVSGLFSAGVRCSALCLRNERDNEKHGDDRSSRLGRL